jgi:hypothetical protein
MNPQKKEGELMWLGKGSGSCSIVSLKPQV